MRLICASDSGYTVCSAQQQTGIPNSQYEKDDPAGPQILLKDLILGAELAKLEKDREEYLQKQGEAQTKVPQASLVGEVRKILDRHGVKWN